MGMERGVSFGILSFERDRIDVKKKGEEIRESG